MERAVIVCKKFMELARAYRAEEVIAVATSATRDASNKVQLLEMLKKEANLEVCTISGMEEARLIYLGVSSGLRLGYSKALFIDIGGGSTEVSVGDQRQCYFLDSLNLGAVRLTNMFLPDETGPVSEEQYEQIKDLYPAQGYRCNKRAFQIHCKLRDWKFGNNRKPCQDCFCLSAQDSP